METVDLLIIGVSLVGHWYLRAALWTLPPVSTV
jgi:hypothetical protein